MRALLRSILKLAVPAMAVLLFSANVARAGSTDTLTVSFVPNAYYAVDIDTANVSLNLGAVNLGASTQTVQPSTVSVQSTFAFTDLKIQGSISSSGTPWTFDNNTVSSDTDKLSAWATFTSVARSSVPTQTADYFSGTVPGANGSDVIDNQSRYVGDSATQGTFNLFENNSGFDAKNMDSLAPEPDPNAKSHLWLYFRLPSATTSATPQNISVTITAVAPD